MTEQAYVLQSKREKKRSNQQIAVSCLFVGYEALEIPEPPKEEEEKPKEEEKKEGETSKEGEL